MPVFILMANGALAYFDGFEKILCRKAFTNKELAEAYIPTFRKACITDPPEGSPGGFSTLLDDDLLKIHVVELDLVEGGLE